MKQIGFVSLTLKLGHQTTRNGNACLVIIFLSLSKEALVSQDWQHHSLFLKLRLYVGFGWSYFVVDILIFAKPPATSPTFHKAELVGLTVVAAWDEALGGVCQGSDHFRPELWCGILQDPPRRCWRAPSSGPRRCHRAEGKAAALPLFIDAAHGFISALIFQVENLVKTKN